MLESQVLTRKGYEKIVAYDVNECIDYLPELRFDRVQRQHKIYRYATDYICLDTETSKLNINEPDEMQIVYNEFLTFFSDYTRGTVIRVPDKWLRNYDMKISDLNKKASILIGKNTLKFSKTKGSPIDTIYDDLVYAGNGSINPYIENEEEQITEVLEYLDILQRGVIVNIEYIAWVYPWAVKIGNVFIYGRKPTELVLLLTILKDKYKLTDVKKICLFIHNAQYDIQYLKHYLLEYDPKTTFFAIDNHTILCCEMVGFRIMCSYKMTNLSLDALSKNYSQYYLKATGLINYNVTRYQDDELTADDWAYMFSDVASQYDGIRQYILSNGYNHIYNAPMTSTGFVREDCRNESKTVNWYKEFNKLRLSYEQYKKVRQCFQGGVTICSYMYSGQTIRNGDLLPDGQVVKLGHKDFTSSYPARQMIDYFPISAPSDYGDIESREEFEYLLNTYCCIFVLYMNNVKLRSGVTAPYIASSKCIELDNPIRLNGKVVTADHLSIIITELDYDIIRKQYHADSIHVSDMIIFDRGKLPEWLRNKVYKYFEGKCTLKGVDDLLYTKQKNRLNGIYGMTATAIIRDEYEMCDNLWLEKVHYNNDEEKENAERNILNKYYNSRRSFMPYQWAIWTTAHARRALYEMIEAVGYEYFLYCDTDSVFYISTPENEERLKRLNDRLRDQAIEAGAYVGTKYLGYMDDEPELTAFRGLHSKCYAMIEENELKVVIAGIPKKAVNWDSGEPVVITNAEELRDIDNLKDGFVFHYCGGTRAIYVERENGIEVINGHETEISSACIIENIDKTISDTMWTVDGSSIMHVVQSA